MKRLFFALIPNDRIRKTLSQLCSSFTAENTLWWVENHNLHITLCFLGNVSEQTQRAIISQVENTSFSAFSISFGQIEYWRQSSVCCLTPLYPEVNLLVLADGLKAFASTSGIDTDQRLYEPHVTLARGQVTVTAADIKSFDWHVTSFCLMESNQGQYTIIKEWSLT